MIKSYIFIFVFAFLILQDTVAQIDPFFQKSMQTNNYGMMVLGTWAISNMTVGAIGWARTSGQTQYFHQMNFFWNTVNISIAGFALYQNFQLDLNQMTDAELLQNHIRIEKLYLINAGLDVLYVGTGLYLRHLADKKPKRQEMLTGYGNSIILQGSFLFVFDLVMYGIQHKFRMNNLDNLTMSFSDHAILFHYSIPI